MKKACLLIIAIIILCLSPETHAQILQDPILIGSSRMDKVYDLQQDKNGNIYVLGQLDFPVTIRTASGIHVLDALGSAVLVFNKNRELLKARSLGFIGQFMYAMAIDDNGNLIFTGRHSSYTFVAAKVDPQFNLIWSITEGSMAGAEGVKALVDKEGNAYVAANVGAWSFLGLRLREKSCCGGNDVLMKISPTGIIRWVRAGYGDYLTASTSSIAFDRTGNIILAGSLQYPGTYGSFTVDPGVGVRNLLAVKYSPEGKVLWAKNYGGKEGTTDAFDVVTDEQNNIYLAGAYSGAPTFGSFTLQPTGGPQDALLLKLDQDGEVVWAKSGGYSAKENKYTGIAYAAGKLQLTGYRDGQWNVYGKYASPILHSFTKDGEEIWESNINVGNTARGVKLLITSENTTYMTGEFLGEFRVGNKSFGSAAEQDVFLMHVLDTAMYQTLSKIQGNISLTGGDCTPGRALKGNLVKATPGNYYGISDENGNYSINVEPGTYKVEPLIPTHYQGNLIPGCERPSPATVEVEANLQTVKDIDFSLKILNESPQLSVDIGKSQLRRCFASNTVVSYCNQGFSDQENVKLKVELPSYVVPLESSIPWSERKGSFLIFDIGTLKAGDCRYLTIKDSVVCDDESIRGLTQCFKATLSADNPPAKKVNIQLSATCRDNGFVRLRMVNEGTSDMIDSVDYRIYLDAEPVFTARYKLQQNDSLVLNVLVNGKTIYLESDLSAGQGQKSITMEGCGGRDKAVVSKGFQKQFPQDDESLWVEEYCLEIVDSYDPNCKEVSPAGIMDAHYISENAPLEYTIRFQNTGTAVAYTVKIEDKLSEFLDISSLQPGLSSHPYKLTFAGGEEPVLRWEFKNIMLPDSTTNEPESHGFVKFKIRQKAANIRGSVIKNKSAIFFDYNSPIITNEVFNTVGLPDPLVQEPAQVQNCNEEKVMPASVTEYIAICEDDALSVNVTAFSKWFGSWKTEGEMTVDNKYAASTKVNKLPYGESVLVWEESYCDTQTEKTYRIARFPQPEKPQTAVKLRPSVELTATGSEIRWYANKDLTEIAGEGNVLRSEDIPCAGQTYYVTQTINGCESKAEEVSFSMDFTNSDFFIANVITPNGDGKNEELFIPPFAYRDCLGDFYSIQIINRWGSIVFSSTDEHFRWEGKDLAAGSYFMVLRYARFTHKGFLTIRY